ncbi:hypothetical protein D3C78_1439590 [compost metagenome]
MGLRVEEDFGMHHVVAHGPCQVGARHVVEVLLVQQHARARIVDVEKTLQVGECVGTAQGRHIGVGQLHLVALGQRKNQFRLQRAFDMDVQLGLGHVAQQGRQGRVGQDGGHQQTPKETPRDLR